MSYKIITFVFIILFPCLSLANVEKKFITDKPAHFYIHEKQRIPFTELCKKTQQVLEYLPHVKNNLGLSKLIAETMVAESYGGENYHIANMGGLGIAQFNYKSAQFLLKWTKQYHHDIYMALIKLKDKKLSLRDNLIHNVSFGAGMCATLYWFYHKDKLYDKCKSLDGRAKLWKKYYNTVKGAGSVAIYKKRVNRYLAGKNI